MPLQRVAIGYPQAILQNVVWALPEQTCRIQSLVAVEVSIDNSTWAALTGANTTGAETNAGWIRCTTGNTTIICKLLN